MTMSQFQTDVLPMFEEHRKEWLERARHTAIDIARRKGEVTIDDVRAECPPPDGVDPRVMGAVFHPRSNWTCIGYARSKRSDCHNRPVAIHVLRELVE